MKWPFTPLSKPAHHKLYRWRGHDVYGRTTQGASFAHNPATLIHILHQHEHITITNIKHSKTYLRKHTINSALLAMTEQLAQLLKAHVTLPQALLLLQHSAPQRLNQAITRHLIMRISQGQHLHQAMGELPHIFQPLYLHIIAISEQSTQLAAGLTCLHQYLYQQQQLKTQLQQALSYPALLAVASLVTLFFLLFSVMPHMAELFQNMHGTLPASTRYVLMASAKVHAHPGYWLTAIIVSSTGVWQTLCRLPATVQDRIPMLGRTWQLIQRCQQLNMLYLVAKAKLPWPAGMALISAQSTRHQQAWQHAYRAVLDGQALHRALAHLPHFHHALCAQLGIAEQSGQLTMTLCHLWQQHTHNTNMALQRLKQQLEPLFTLGIGCIIAGFMVLCYIPLLQLGDALWSTSMNP